MAVRGEAAFGPFSGAKCDHGFISPQIPPPEAPSLQNSLARDVETRRGQRESVKAEPRRHGATHKCPVAGGVGRLPMAFGNDDLRRIASHEIGTKPEICHWAVVRCGDAQNQWRARIPVPDFDGIHMVPMAVLTLGEQEIDASPRGPPGVFGHPSLAVIAAFGMRRQVQVRDDVLCVHVHRLGWPQRKQKG